MYFKFKTFLYYLLNDRYWLTKKISLFFYKIVQERKLMNIFIKNELSKLLKLETIKKDKDQ